MHILTVQLLMLLIADRVLFKKTNKQKKKQKSNFLFYLVYIFNKKVPQSFQVFTY